jgi:undecaprenyl pyrophosphate phosphatase UppP
MGLQERGAVRLWFNPIVVIIAAGMVVSWFIQKWLEKSIFENQTLTIVLLAVVTGTILIALLVIWHIRNRHREREGSENGEIS